MTLKLQLGCWLTCLLMLAGTAQAQVRNSGAQAIALNATLPDGLSIRLSGNAVNFNLTAGRPTNAGSTGITATSSWFSKAGRTLSVYAYFSSATAALTDGVTNIPSSAFQISNNGGAYTALTNTVNFGAANAGLRLSTVRILGGNKIGSHDDNMLFNINLSALPQLPASIYTGTLNIQAQII